jgi:tripartite ATP-independent transporter DctP family solute receptor
MRHINIIEEEKNMKKLHRFMLIAMTILMVFSLTACGEKAAPAPQEPAAGEPAAAPAEAVVIKLGTTVNEQDSFQIAAEKFAELVADRTKNAYKIEIYPNGALGDERTMLESMQMGTLDMGIITSGPFVNFAPEMGVLDMPFLFGSNEDVYKILDGEIGKELLTKLEPAQLKGLAYAERGFRNLTNSVRPVEKAADITGLKVRVMENEVYISTFESLGVNTVPMAWSEALTALQQGTIQGQENPVNVIHAFKLWESQKYVTMTRHAYAAALITMSLDKFNSLPADVQQIFMDAAQEAAEFERAWVAENEDKQMADLETNGMEIVKEPDLESFRAAVAKVYDKYPQYKEYLTRIEAALK